MVTIRSARLEDIPAMREVAIESYIDKFAAHNTPENMEAFLQEAYNLDQLIREFHEEGSILMLAFDQERVVGFVRLRKNSEVDHYLGSNHIELQRLYIHPQFQNMKIGKMLMEFAMDYAITGKFDWIWLGVWERNFEAQRFYAKWGFKKFSEHVFQMGDDPQIDWLLKKSLKKN